MNCILCLLHSHCHNSVIVRDVDAGLLATTSIKNFVKSKIHYKGKCKENNYS
ncbi:hypothetical protein T10_4218 [Trichinella papuae]|uniref:Uncharacterized protein n=1 Tax=Trichinella papuae TaxID=268474 RepID=A0A0V1MB37_9BILA|nr:hypothetical protein T10_4218 [Trichinella papuae]